MYARDTEIRHISSADVFKLGQILEQTNSWKKLMRIIPSTIDGLDSTRKYNNDHIKLIENASIKQNRMSTEILFDEWGTSGRKRPTVGNLLELLIKAELFRAADFVAQNFLNEPLPERPIKGPAAKVDITLPLLSEDIHEVEKVLNEAHYPGTRTLIENIQSQSDMNNKDFFEKVTFDEKKVENDDSEKIKSNLTSDTSDLIKFSSENFESMVMTDNIPILSQLVSVNNLMGNGLPNTVEVIQSNELKSNEIPMLSLFDNEDLPNLSVLNGRHEKNNEKFSEMINDENSCSSTSTSISSASDENALTPNLSILNQTIENVYNDSSLTSVTETSDDSSFSSDGGQCNK